MPRRAHYYLLSVTFCCLSMVILRGQPSSPQNFVATGYDSHVEVAWSPVVGAAGGYQIHRSTDGGTTFSLLKTVSDTTAIDFVRPLGLNLSLQYKVRAVGTASSFSDFTTTKIATVKPATDDELMEMVQRYTFRYFRELAHPIAGLARERNTSGNTVTSGGSGFGIMAWVVAMERGWVSRTEGVNHISNILSFLLITDRFHGVFSHWIDGNNGNALPFSQFDNGGDLVETSFLIQGLLTARQYFDRNTMEETWIRETITQLWRQVEWSWYRRGGQNVLYWHWSPQHEWRMNFALRGYYEALITYILAVASPTHPIPATVYHQGWAGNPSYRNGQTYYGHRIQVGPGAGGPLFFAHYSFLGFDPRRKKDAYANYFLHNVAQSLVNQAYCAANPRGFLGYSADCWGLTSSDDPSGYSAHAPLDPSDNGTITPTAALGSMPYTPAASMRALKHFYRERGDKLWGKFGFYDAFNPTRNWTANSYLAIDQGPIVCMIENHRTGLLWRLFMQNPEIKTALDAIGFVADATSTPSVSEPISMVLQPNPTQNQSFLQFNLKKDSELSLEMADAAGRLVKVIFSKKTFSAGENNLLIDAADVPSGFYQLILRGSDFVKNVKMVKN
jgi:hypothetical protein